MRIEHRRFRPGWLAAIALVGALLPVAVVAAQSPTGAVAGQVTDARSAEGAAGVSVEVQGTRLGAITRADGRYRVGGLPAGSYTIVARRIGYASARQSVAVSANGEVTANFSLQPAAVSLDQVVVTGTAGGQERRTIATAVSTI